MTADRLTAHEKALIRHSFGRIACRQQATAQYFFERLLALDPEVGITREEHRDRFLRTLALLVRSLDDSGNFRATAHSLNGVPRDWTLTGDAFLWALQQSLGAAFTPRICAAWTRFYTVLIAEMEATG